MELRCDLKSLNKRWALGNVCALLVGVLLRTILSNPAANPALSGTESIQFVSRIGSYLFSPWTYIVVAILCALAVLRARCVGLWSVFLSFMIGGLLASSFLALF